MWIVVGKEAYKPLLLEKNGIKVAILALAELQFGMVHDSFTQANDYGCAWINHPCVNRLVRETKKKVDCKQSLRAVLRTLIKIYTFAPNFKFGTK